MGCGGSTQSALLLQEAPLRSSGDHVDFIVPSVPGAPEGKEHSGAWTL